MIKGFKNFLLRGDVIVIAIGLIVALAFSTLIKAFTDSVIDPLISRAQGGHAVGLGVQLGQTGNSATFVNFGSFISAIVYFLIFMAVVYFAVVVPYKNISAGAATSCSATHRQPRLVPPVFPTTSPQGPPSASTAALISRLRPWTLLRHEPGSCVGRSETAWRPSYGRCLTSPRQRACHGRNGAGMPRRRSGEQRSRPSTLSR